MADDVRTEYALVTPARNEANVISHVLQAVTSQELRPLRWVIVSDGSTDDTDAIVADWAQRYPFIRLVRRASSGPGDFASKVHAFNLGVQHLADLDYKFIGNLDADVAFTSDYFRKLLEVFDSTPRLGIAGGQVTDPDGHSREATPYSVAGAVQLFRRECFEEVGGLPPLRLGGEDAAAQITARALGWTVATVPLSVQHVRTTGHRHGTQLRAFYRQGLINDRLGYDPAFMVAWACRRITQPPAVIGAVASLAGFAVSAWRRTPHALGATVVVYLRSEQRERLRDMLQRPT